MSDKPTCPCPVTAVTKAFRLPKPPFFLTVVPVIGACTLMLVAALIFKGRYATSRDTRVAPVQDMARQPKFKAQADTAFFADGRAMRLPAAGSVAYGNGSFGHETPSATYLKADDHFYRGYAVGKDGKPVLVKADGKDALKFFAGYPSKELLTVDAALLHLGQTKFNQNCAICHGKDGSGEGPVNARAQVLAGEENNPTATTWVKPADLRSLAFTETGDDKGNKMSNGQLLFTVNHGKNAMAGYGSQFSARESWAVVAYVRALQRAANSGK